MNKLLLSVLGAATLFVGSATATITVQNPTVTAGGGNYSWNYSITGDPSENLVAGQAQFVIYDFAGYIAGSISAPANWTASTQYVGPTPASVNVPDNAGLINLVFSYTGPTVASPGGSTTGFSAWSSYGAENLNGVFTYVAQKASNPTADDSGKGPIAVPSPEPLSMSLIGGGLALLGLARFRRK